VGKFVVSTKIITDEIPINNQRPDPALHNKNYSDIVRALPKTDLGYRFNYRLRVDIRHGYDLKLNRSTESGAPSTTVECGLVDEMG
jgi:hypothetical protein